MALYAREEALFEENLDRWMESQPEKWMAVKGDQVLGPFDTDQEAFGAAIRTWQTDEFLLRQVTREVEVLSLPFVSSVRHG
jgi:hypothetical protein